MGTHTEIGKSGKKHLFGLQENKCNKSIEVDFSQNTFPMKVNIPFNERVKEFYDIFTTPLTFEKGLFDIAKDGDNTSINDGGSDVFDGGHKVSIDGTLREYTADTDLQPNSKIFKWGRVFFHEDKEIRFKKFEISGNYGADGNTQKSNFKYQTYLNTGLPVVVFVNQKKGNDPSTTTVQYVLGAYLDEYDFEENASGDNYKAVITTKAECPKELTVGSLLFATQSNSVNFTEDEVKEFMTFYLDRVYGIGIKPLPLKYRLKRYPVKILRPDIIRMGSDSRDKSRFPSNELIHKYAYLEVDTETKWGTLHLDFNIIQDVKWNEPLFELPDYVPRPRGFMEDFTGHQDDKLQTYNCYNHPSILHQVFCTGEKGVRYQANLLGYFE